MVLLRKPSYEQHFAQGRNTLTIYLKFSSMRIQIARYFMQNEYVIFIAGFFKSPKIHAFLIKKTCSKCNNIFFNI